MPLKLSNNAVGILASSITESGTSVVLAPGQGAKFPALNGGDWFPITVVRSSEPTTFEIMHVTAREGDVLTAIRAQEGTTAVTFSVGDIVEHRLTSGALDRDFVRIDSDSIEGVRLTVTEDDNELIAKVHADEKEFEVAHKSDVITLEAKVLELDDDVRKVEEEVEGIEETLEGLGTAAYAGLTTSDTDRTDGRVLKTGDFGIGKAIELKPGLDLNDILVPGEYRWSQTIAPSNRPPSSDWAYLKVTSWREAIGAAQQVCITSNGLIYIRTRSDSGAWTSWSQVYPANRTIDYLSGTVESAGIGTANDPPGTVNFSGGRVLTGLRTDGGGNWYSIYARGRTLTT